MIIRKKLLEVTNLSSSYDGCPVLTDINFTLGDGEILCLLGPSGSGKTTLLRLLAGLAEMENGEIIFNDKDIRQIPPHKRNFGMMFQEYALFPHKNVTENVAFGLEMKHLAAIDVETRVQSLLESVGLGGFGGRRIDELSGGEKQRVALARSLAPEPRLLLLDEPLGSLDKTLRDRLASEIRTILKSLGLTSIFVTHDQSEAFSVADKVAILHDNTMQQFDTPENIYRYPANESIARFLGFKNIIYGRVDENCIFHTEIGKIPLAQRHVITPVKDATLLIRPEGAVVKNKGAPLGKIQLSGTVTDRTFQGSTYKLTLNINGKQLIFDLPIDPTPAEPGDSIQIFLPASSLVLLS